MAEMNELWASNTSGELSIIIRAVYKQVLGNLHIMDSERLVNAESQLRNGTTSVREFVRAIAKSSLYRSRYFEHSAPYRFVEVNTLHLLGRAPLDQNEISTHVCRCIGEGYEAEIDSYIDSDEYLTAFGENTVPYARAERSIMGQSQIGYNRVGQLACGYAGADSNVTASILVGEIIDSSKTRLVEKVYRERAYVASAKRFKIVATAAKFDAPRRCSTTTYVVSGDKMTPQIQRINRTGAKIVSITEIY